MRLYGRSCVLRSVRNTNRYYFTYQPRRYIRIARVYLLILVQIKLIYWKLPFPLGRALFANI